MYNIYIKNIVIKKVSFIMLIILLCVDNCIFAQDSLQSVTLPSPIRNYPLRTTNSKIFEDLGPGKKKGVLMSGYAHPFTDRFGDPYGAMRLHTGGVAGGYIQLPPVTPDEKLFENGYTISYWTYIGEELSPPASGVQPYSDADTKYSIYSFGVGPGGTKILGSQRIRDRLVIDRTEGLVRGWKLWLWDPVSFQKQKGWYHIVEVYNPNKMRIYISKPDGSLECSSNYISSPPINPPSWILGTSDGSYKPIEYLDDYKAFNVPLNELQVKELMRRESAAFDQEGSMNIMNKYSNKYLDNGKQMNIGSYIFQYHLTDSEWQKWYFILANKDETGSTYYIMNKYSGKYLSCNGREDYEPIFQDNTLDSSKEWIILPAGEDVKGKFFYIWNKHSAKVLDNNKSSAESSRIIQYDKKDIEWQKWYITPSKSATPIKSGNYRIRFNYSLDPEYTFVLGNQLDGHQEVLRRQRWRPLSNKDQNWTITPSGTGFYWIHTQSKLGINPLYLTYSRTSAELVASDEPPQSSSTHWLLEPIQEGPNLVYKIISLADDLRPALFRGATFEDNDNSMDSKYTLVNIDNPPLLSRNKKTYKIYNEYSGKAVENGNSYTNGAPIIQWFGNNQPWQEWDFEYQGNDIYGDYFSIINKSAGKYYVENERSLEDKASLVQWTGHNGSWQDWYIDWSGTWNKDNGPLYYIFNRYNLQERPDDPKIWYIESKDDGGKVLQKTSDKGTFHYFTLINVSSASETAKTSQSQNRLEMDSKKNVKKAYPNPSKGLLNVPIELKESGIVHFRIYNALGVAVMEKSISLETGSHVVKVDNPIHNNSVKGVYLLKVTTNKGKEILSQHIFFE